MRPENGVQTYLIIKELPGVFTTYSYRANIVPPNSHRSGNSDLTLFGNKIFADITSSGSGDEIILALERLLNLITDVLIRREDT